MSLEKLTQIGWYKAEPSSPKEIADLFSIVDRSQADLKVEGISDDLRFRPPIMAFSHSSISLCAPVAFASLSARGITSA